VSDLVERYTIRPIPSDRRHGSARSLFPFWFTANSSAFTVVLGAVGIELGLGVIPSIIAIVLGGAVGGIFMAYHSAQGPKLGLTQLTQSRAQFGFYGSLLPNFAIWLIFLGYIVGENVLAGDAFAGLAHITYAEAVAVTSFATWLVVFFGYRIIHDFNKVVAVGSLIFFVILLVRLVQHAAGAAHIDTTSFSFPTWLLFFSVNVSGQVGWAPYVSDYSRYLPARTSLRASFWYTYAGSVISAVIFAILGVLAGAVALSDIESNTVGYLARLLPGAIWLVTIVLLLSIVAGNAINLYSPLLTGVAIASKDGGAAPGATVRGIGTGVIMAITGYLATVVSANFVTDVSDFISFLLYIVIPWSAINLVDYYFVRRGNYGIQAIFTPGGPYGRVNWRTILIFLAGIAVEIPFMNASYPQFEGPAASALSGADISWLVGFLIAGGLYYVLTPKGTAASAAAQPAEVVGELPAFGVGPRIIVDFERFLPRALPLRDVLQVESYPGPRRAAAAHRVDKHVSGLQVTPHVAVPRLPPLQALHRLGLGGRPRDLDQRFRRLPPPGAAAGAWA
jgi:nucleobase:cation symporter-1, NCS1 family